MRALAFFRRALRRQPRSTTVTVTRVVGTTGDDHEEPTPDVVVVETQEPEKDTGALQLVRLTFAASMVTLGVLIVYVAFRTVRYEVRRHMQEG